MDFDNDYNTSNDSMLACPHCSSVFDAYTVFTNGDDCAACGTPVADEDWIQD